jgi:hypothetical protein
MLGVCLIPPDTVFAGRAEDPLRLLSIKAGMVGSGDVEVGAARLRQDKSFSLAFASEFPAGEHFHYGLSADFLWMNWTGDDLGMGIDASETLLDLHISVKGNVDLLGRRVTMRPGVGIGYGVMGRQSRLNPMNFLTLRASAEAIYWLPKARGLLLEAIWWNAPNGGDDDTDVTIGALPVFRVGFVF